MILRALLACLACSGVATAGEVMTLQWESGLIALEPADIAHVAAEEKGVTIRLSEELSDAFADLTGQLIGEPLAILVCGQEVARPVVRESFASGSLVFTASEPVAAVAVLTGQRPCADLNVDE